VTATAAAGGGAAAAGRGTRGSADGLPTAGLADKAACGHHTNHFFIVTVGAGWRIPAQHQAFKGFVAFIAMVLINRHLKNYLLTQKHTRLSIFLPFFVLFVSFVVIKNK
jgi:hypothetical protein